MKLSKEIWQKRVEKVISQFKDTMKTISKTYLNSKESLHQHLSDENKVKMANKQKKIDKYADHTKKIL